MRHGRHPSMNRLEDTSVPRWRHTSTTPEQAPKEGGVLVSYSEGDLVNWAVRRFQRVLGLFDAKVLHVVNEGEAGGLLEAAFQRALWNLRVPDDACHHAGLSEVPPEPSLAAAHHGIGVRLLAHEWLVWQLPLVVPLQQVDLRDAHRLSRAHVPGDDVQREVMPGCRAARRDDAAGGVGEAEIRLGAEAHLRVLASEQIS